MNVWDESALFSDYRFRHDKEALVGVGEDASVSFRKTKQSVNNKM